MTGMIIVTAYPNELKKIEQFLNTAENSLNKQVMLEAKVLEVDLNDGYRSGINWALLNDHMKISQIGNDLNKDESLTTSSIINSVYAQPPNNSRSNLSTGTTHSAPSIPTTVSNFGGLLTLGMNYRKLATFVELLSAQGNVQVLSSPRITTSNNQKALIKVGNDQFFITNVTTTTTTAVGGGAGAASSASTPTVTLSPFFSGIALDVTPQIGEDDLTLHIHPTVSTITGIETTIPGSGSFPLAKSSIRESDSIVRAKNGQLIVIGGLMQDKTAEIITGIPFFKDIPFVGQVFRHTRQQATKSELVILLRPTILDDYKMKHQLQNTYKRINDLDQGFHAGGDSKWYGNLGESQ
jgi:MSHA biogenesis protein MshL